MKLKIKKTGEILENVKFIDTSIHKFIIRYLDDNTLRDYAIDSLSDIEEVKDYEELKEYWYVSCAGRIAKATSDEDDYNEKHIAGHKEIGNHFETKEEAELVARKLKAFNRLKGKGFRFIGKTYETGKRFGSIFYKVDDDTYSEDIIDDLDLLFGGEK